MTHHMIAWYASDKLSRFQQSENRSAWIREALSMYMDAESVDANVIAQLPVGKYGDGKKIITFIGDDLYGMLSDFSARMGEPMYSIVTKAALYRQIFEDGHRTITIRLTDAEVSRLTASGSSIADSIHAMIAEVSE